MSAHYQDWVVSCPTMESTVISALRDTIQPTSSKANGPLSIPRCPFPIHVADGLSASDPSIQLAPRHALAALPKLFSEERMMHTIQWLTDESLQGRGLGTPELNRVTEFLVDAFRKAGLTPGGPNDSYLQTWQANIDTHPRRSDYAQCSRNYSWHQT